MSNAVGIDFGGVIVRNLDQTPGEDTSLGSSIASQVARKGAIEAIREIVHLVDGRVWIVSKAGPKMQALTLAWMDQVDFFSRTGVNPASVRFCLRREDKRPICEELEITHFIDDRVHVMQILRGAVQNLCLFGESGGERFCPPWATFESSWIDVVDWLSRTIRADHSSDV